MRTEDILFNLVEMQGRGEFEGYPEDTLNFQVMTEEEILGYEDWVNMSHN